MGWEHCDSYAHAIRRGYSKSLLYSPTKACSDKPKSSVETKARHASNPFFRVFQFSSRQQRLEVANRKLACRTNPHYGVGGDFDRGSHPNLVRACLST